MNEHRLIVGCGYVGMRVARRWLAGGDRVTALTRSVDRAVQLRREGIDAIVGDVTQPETLTRLPSATTVLYAVGYDRGAGPSIEEVYAGGVRNTLAALSEAVRRLVYVSTTGVYGDAGGRWVDENTPPSPSRAGGRASLAAERETQTKPWRQRSVALRLAGIYGPDRVPHAAVLRAGEAIEARPEGWLNLIHVDDAATCVLAAADAEDPPPVVCVSDGQPPRRSAYYAEVARLVGAPVPRFAEPPTGSPRAARAASDKRVRNQLMLERLGVTLAHPDYRSGLAAVLGGGA